MSFSLFDLNPEQDKAVRTIDGPLLILAGAGSGKTRVITMRVAYLMSKGVPPQSILAVTFTNKAATEMRERLAKMIEPSQAKKVLMSTFHALCVRLLRQEIEVLGYKKNFSIYDDGDQIGLIKKIIAKVGGKDEKLDPNVAKNAISKAKNSGWRAMEDPKTLLAAVFARYQTELKLLNAVDFDDLLLLAVKALDEHPEVRQRWQNKFSYLMVDEFQDTNRLQLELIRLLADERKNVAVVGDDDQSIYGWRGAEVSNILEFEAHFSNPTVVKLEQNYRSTNAILKTANTLIKNNPRRRPKTLWSSSGEGEMVRVIAMEDDKKEAAFIAAEIFQKQASTSAKWEDFAVLVRMNAQTRNVEQELRQLKIPYKVIGGKSFFDRREVKDLLAYASAILNTDDDVSMLRILNTPPRGISDTTIEKAMDYSAKQSKSVFGILKDEEFRRTLTSRVCKALDEFYDLFDRYETRLLEPLSNQAEILKELITEVEYFEDLKKSCKTPEEALSREQNVRELIGSLADYQTKSDEGLRGFLDQMMLRQEREEEDDERGSGVSIITLHAAKGLEFPHVYLIGLEEGVLPHDRSRLEGTIDEERRLLYVGITRARESLAITWCAKRYKFGSVVSCTPSSFLRELPSETVKHHNGQQLANRPVEQETAKNRFAAMRALLEQIPPS